MKANECNPFRIYKIQNSLVLGIRNFSDRSLMERGCLKRKLTTKNTKIAKSTQRIKVLNSISL